MREAVLLLLTGNDVITAIEATAIVTFTLSFVLFYVLHNDNVPILFGVEQLPTLSLTGGYLPERIIFSMGLAIFAFWSLTLFPMIYVLYREKIDNLLDGERTPEKPDLHKINDVLLVIGVIFSCLLLLTGAVPITVAETTHAVLAILMFITGVVHLLLFVLTLAPRFPNTRQQGWQVGAALIAAPVNVLALIASFVTLAFCDSRDCRELAAQMVVVVEYTTVVALLMYLEGFRTREMGRTFLLTQQRQVVAEGCDPATV